MLIFIVRVISVHLPIFLFGQLKK